MKKSKSILTKNSIELAEALGLPSSYGLEIEIRSDINEKIISTVRKKGLTHAEVAKLAKTSRTRITAIMNRNTLDVSTDLMLRILGAVGVQAKIQFKQTAA